MPRGGHPIKRGERAARTDFNFLVKAPRPTQRRIQGVGPIGGRQDEDGRVIGIPAHIAEGAPHSRRFWSTRSPTRLRAARPRANVRGNAVGAIHECKQRRDDAAVQVGRRLAALRADHVQLVDEDEGRGALPRFVKERTQLAQAPALAWHAPPHQYAGATAVQRPLTTLRTLASVSP